MSISPNLLFSGETHPIDSHQDSEMIVSSLNMHRRNLWIIVVVSIVVSICFFGPLAYGGLRIWSVLERLPTHFNALRRSFENQDIQQANVTVGDVRRDVRDLHQAFQILSFWRFLPWIGDDLLLLERLGEISEQIAQAAQEMTSMILQVEEAIFLASALDPKLQHGISPMQTFRQLSSENKQTVLARFDALLPELRHVRERVRMAAQSWKKFPQDSLMFPFRKRLDPYVRALPRYAERLDRAVTFLDVLLPIVGYPQEQRVLFLLQNADELRPTGGFIGVTGQAVISAGEIMALSVQDVYQLDHAAEPKWTDVPPDVLRDELGIRKWFLRDRNWSPDFPRSASDILDVFDREQQASGVTTTHPTLVIAFNPEFFEELLSWTGPLRVQGKVFPPKTFIDQLEYDVEQGFREDQIPRTQRKDVVANLGQALIQHLLDQPLSRWSEIMDIVFRRLERKDILIFAKDYKLQSLLDERGWSGRTRTSQGDYLWIVDANLLGQKTDRMMQKDVRYALDASDSKNRIATLTLRYRNTHQGTSWRYGRYRDYVRVFVPEGSELLSVRGAMEGERPGSPRKDGQVEVMHDLGKTVFGAFIAVDSGETKEVLFRYRLPDAVFPLRDMYTLRIQKQPGSNTKLTLDLLFDKTLKSADPPEEKFSFGDDRYRVSFPLELDRDVMVRMK